MPPRSVLLSVCRVALTLGRRLRVCGSESYIRMYQLAASGTLSALPNLDLASAASDACFTSTGNLVVTLSSGAVEVYSRGEDGTFTAAAQSWQDGVSAALSKGKCQRRRQAYLPPHLTLAVLWLLQSCLRLVTGTSRFTRHLARGC